MFDVESIKIEPNKDEKTNKLYLETIHVTIEEKNTFPSCL